MSPRRPALLAALAALAALAVGCANGHGAAGRVPPGAPELWVDSPQAGSFLSEPETDVRGRFRTFDGQAWIWVESTQARVTAPGTFVAERVPLREGRMDIKVHLTDARKRTALRTLRVGVESPDRPRSRKLCRPGGPCFAYEERGIPKRDASGRIVNAVVVVTSFGFDEKLDRLWPDMVGPDRPLDSKRSFIVGVAPAYQPDGALASFGETVALLEQLLDERRLARPARVVGASSMGAEVVLRWLATHPTSIARAVVAGGHDRPWKEPAFRELAEYLATAAPSGAPAAAERERFWQGLAKRLVGWSYTDAYLADVKNATEHGLLAEARRTGFRPALVNKMARHFATTMPPRDLARRLQSARDLTEHPPTYALPASMRVTLVANRLDRLVHLEHVEETAARLRAAGAQVELVTFSDPLGHSAFFARSPRALAEALRALQTP